MSKETQEPQHRWECKKCHFQVHAPNEFEAQIAHTDAQHGPCADWCKGDMAWQESVEKTKPRPNF